MVYNIFNDIKAIYSKNKSIALKEDRETYQNISILKWFSYDEDNLPILKKILHYIFFIEPLHFLLLLYFNIPRKQIPPFLHKIHKEEAKENKLFSKIKETLQWSDRELKLHTKLLEKTVLINEKYWSKQLGVL